MRRARDGTRLLTSRSGVATPRNVGLCTILPPSLFWASVEERQGWGWVCWRVARVFIVTRSVTQPDWHGVSCTRRAVPVAYTYVDSSTPTRHSASRPGLQKIRTSCCRPIPLLLPAPCTVKHRLMSSRSLCTRSSSGRVVYMVEKS